MDSTRKKCGIIWSTEKPANRSIEQVRKVPKLGQTRQEICKNGINDQQLYSLLILFPPMDAASHAEDTPLFPSAGTAADPLRSPKALKWLASQR